MTSVVEPFEIRGVVRLHSASDSPSARPHVAIVGSVHGNEPCGLRAIERLRAELTSGQLHLDRGTLYLVHGNPRASQLGERHTEDGVDLNRLFDYRFETALPSALWTYEHHRAIELKPLLEGVDALLDLHSTTAPSPAFAIVSALPGSRDLGAALKLGYITDGWDGPGLLAGCVVSAPLTRRGLPAVSVECGQHGDLAAADVAYACIRRALAYLGVLPAIGLRTDAGGAAGRAPIHLRLRAAVKRPSADFKFARPLSSMQRLVAGDLLGSDDDLALTLKRSCYIIMPNDDVAMGEDMVYIAQPAGGV